MAVALVTDIVMDVLKAADPAAAEAARVRLAGRASSATEGAGFAAALAPKAEAGRAEAIRETAKKFEAMVLQNFLQSMMPKDAEAVYGSGLSGDMWKSLMAEKIAEAVAERGGVGIADRIAAEHYFEGERKVPVKGLDADPNRAELDRQALLSAALVQEIQRSVMLGSPDTDGNANRNENDV